MKYGQPRTRHDNVSKININEVKKALGTYFDKGIVEMETGEWRAEYLLFARMGPDFRRGKGKMKSYTMCLAGLKKHLFL